MVMTDPDARRRRLSLALLMVIAVLGALTFHYAGNAASTVAALEKSDQVAGCRASYRVAVDDAQAYASTLFLRGLAAATTDDDAVLSDLLSKGADGLSKIDRSLDAIEASSDAYSDAVALSLADPDAFLDECRDHFPT